MRRLLFSLLIGTCMTLTSLQSEGFPLYRICQSNDTITLNFNSISDTCNEFISYEVYWQSNPNQDFQLVETINDPGAQKFEHNPNNLNNLEEWRYFIKANTGCSNSTVYTDTLGIDKNRPASIELDSLTVKQGKIKLGWTKHPNSGIKGYTIYYVDGGQTRKLDKVFGHNNTTYTVNDPDIVPNANSEKFRIGVFDSCGNESPVSTKAHSSIYLKSLNVDTCERTIDLDWTDYEGWEVGSYVVVAKPEGGKPQSVKRLDGNTTSTTISSLEGGKFYQVFVRAIRADGGGDLVSSSSNGLGTQLGATDDLGFAYFRAASVVDSQVSLRFAVENNSGLQNISVLKGPEPGELSTFTTISPVRQSEYSIIDSVANPQVESRYYRIRANGVCQGRTVNSNIARNMLLEVRTVEDSIRLRWRLYEVFNGGVDKYEVQRLTQAGDLENWETIASVPREQDTYQKLNEFKESEERRACFRIRAVEGRNNEFGYQESSLSNVVCLLNDANVYIPNAIVIGGKNNAFNVRGQYIDYDASSMAIYNRWGEEVYQTNDLNNGWDGTKDGEAVPQGQYLYKVTIVGENQQTSTKSGTFTVIR